MVSEQGFTSFWRHWWWLFVKGYHVLEFAVLTLFLCGWLRRPVLVCMGLVALYAVSDEVHQCWVPERGGRVTDVLIDCIGVLAAGCLVTFRRSHDRSATGS